MYKRQAQAGCRAEEAFEFFGRHHSTVKQAAPVPKVVEELSLIHISEPTRPY